MVLCDKELGQQKEKLKQKYIGKTERTLKDKISEHLGHIRNKNITQATGYHFNLSGHSQDNFRVTLLEKVMKTDPLYRKER